jgi:peptidoglycan/xylan/chitin deacetylase (PgdA/CDA1 family)
MPAGEAQTRRGRDARKRSKTIQEDREMLRLRPELTTTRLLVLGYHNVEGTWRWPARRGRGIANFARQMRILKRLTNIVPLDEALTALAGRRSLPPRAVAITFDDGYRDNVTQAVPLLRYLQIPATIFLVPGFLSATEQAWWEQLGWAITQSTVDVLEFGAVQFDLTEAPAARTAALDAIERSLKELNHERRQAAVAELVERLQPAGRYRADELFMSWDEARDLRGGGISIGSHTMRHAILAREDGATQRADLRESRTKLESALDVQVHLLAYPNGRRTDYEAVTISAARDAGYTHAVTAWGCTSTANTPVYEIHRKMVDNQQRSLKTVGKILREFAMVREHSTT